MSLKSNKGFLYFTFLIILSLNFMLNNGSANLTSLNPTVILFDESHGQFFNHSLYTLALSDLAEKDFEVIYNTNPIDRTTLDGVDIFVSTNPTEFFSLEEKHYISNYLVNGKSMLLLANPLDEENDSLNGGGFIFNEILTTAAADIGQQIGIIRYFVKSEASETIKPSDVIRNDFENIGNPYNLLINVNSSAHELLSGDQNITSIITQSCSIIDAREDIIIASPEAYSVTTLNQVQSFSSKIILMGTAGSPDIGTRILLGGSSIMFSDLKGPSQNLTWYESANNSLLWKNIFTWLERKGPADIPLFFNSDEVILLLGIILITFIAFLIIGSLFFAFGTGRKTKLVKTEELIPVIPVKTPISSKKAESPTESEIASASKETKRDRRLRQIKKHSRGKKK